MYCRGLTHVHPLRVLGILASTYAGTGRIVEARESIRLALEIADYGDNELRARTFSRAAVVAFYDSDEEMLESHSREGIRLATEIGAYGIAARMCGALAAIIIGWSWPPQSQSITYRRRESRGCCLGVRVGV